MKLDFISIQATYAQAQIAIFKNSKFCAISLESDSRGSSHLVPYSYKLLSEHKLSLKDLAFIAIDKGPGAFTSLRVAIATVNGIAFGNKMSLVGVDSLEALTFQTVQYLKTNKSIKKPDFIISLLNAYNNDVYYQISSWGGSLDKGCKKIGTLIDYIQEQFKEKKLLFVGNGFELHCQVIKDNFTTQIVHEANLFMTPSAETIGILGLEKFNKKEKLEAFLEPNYIKEQVFAIRTKPKTHE